MSDEQHGPAPATSADEACQFPTGPGGTHVRAADRAVRHPWAPGAVLRAPRAHPGACVRRSAEQHAQLAAILDRATAVVATVADPDAAGYEDRTHHA